MSIYASLKTPLHVVNGETVTLDGEMQVNAFRC